MNILPENKYSEVWKSLDGLSPSAAFVVTVIHMGKILSEAGDKHTFSAQGLDMDEFEALFIIEGMPGCRPTDITGNSVMQPAKITRVLDRLEKKGHIVREAGKNDRRSFTLKLTASGKTCITDAKKAMVDGTAGIEKAVGIDTLQSVNTLLRQLMTGIGGGK